MTKIPCWEDYEVNEKGEVFSHISNKKLGGTSVKDGYIQVMLRKRNTGATKRMLVHQLVAKMFIPNPEMKGCINHKNFNKSDNRVENLEWCTRAENNKHYIKAFTLKKYKLKPDQIDKIRKEHKVIGCSYESLVRKYNISRSTIIKIIKRRGLYSPYYS